MTSFETRVFRLSMAGPSDVSPLSQLFDAGQLEPAHVVAVIGKTEGNGGVNDFTRGYFTQSLMLLLARQLGITPDEAMLRVPCVLSGGTEGVLSPHMTIFARVPAAQRASAPALAIGIAFADPVPAEAVGRMAQLEVTARAVEVAIGEAGLGVDEVEFVQVKAPGLTSARIQEARERGADVVTADTNRAMALSRSAAALGAALTLGDVSRARLTDSAIGDDMTLFSSRVSVSSGIEITRTEIIAFGNSLRWSGPLRIAHRPMADALDIGAIHATLDELGIPSFPAVAEADRGRIKAVLVKGMPDPKGTIRGFRHTMLDDTDINAQRHIRAALGGVASAIMGDGRIFVSGGAEHQGPDGGGLLAVIAEAR
ncbi:ring-opening amidohydrolase [Lichenifustis flavocetrariae]|uniref:Cyclic amide hydrolase n=1 Tax=Lichenifustis flavocetrariae TaxID=2949735 RepID=A0AA41Z0J1_9HYPH|nr:ring-opening amidohydrolase [Lichenifustis flavocetrariae]MCW6510620.1 ring-opening amidohydrolase [Lichenifustis flavocetrariae]